MGEGVNGKDGICEMPGVLSWKDETISDPPRLLMERGLVVPDGASLPMPGVENWP